MKYFSQGSSEQFTETATAFGTASDRENKVGAAFYCDFNALIELRKRRVWHYSAYLCDILSAFLQNADNLVINPVLFYRAAAINKIP